FPVNRISFQPTGDCPRIRGQVSPCALRPISGALRTAQLGPDATEPWFWSHAEKAPLIHLAVLRRFCVAAPMSSGVLLAVPERPDEAEEAGTDGALPARQFLVSERVRH